MSVWFIIPAVAFMAAAVAIARVVRFRSWYRASVANGGYFSRSSADREAFAREVRERGRFTVGFLERLKPILPPLPGGKRPGGVHAPVQCADEDFQRAIAYRPCEGDIFVVTQMKCGTTWMLQLVYEALLHGHGDLSDSGGRHIHAVAPWIEASWAVTMDEAPRLGERKERIIKSHLPAHLLPIAPQARYIYVARHPAACFASCVDFISMLTGSLAPSREWLLDWFCSERMWWGSWPDHVEGWWRASCEHPNVLFIHFEEMKADLPSTVDRVAAFLDLQLTPEERAEVVRKSGFEYMKQHEDRFTMTPPSAFEVVGGYLRSGKASRNRDAADGERRRIAEFCRLRWSGGKYASSTPYRDLLET